MRQTCPFDILPIQPSNLCILHIELCVASDGIVLVLQSIFWICHYQSIPYVVDLLARRKKFYRYGIKSDMWIMCKITAMLMPLTLFLLIIIIIRCMVFLHCLSVNHGFSSRRHLTYERAGGVSLSTFTPRDMRGLLWLCHCVNRSMGLSRQYNNNNNYNNHNHNIENV